MNPRQLEMVRVDCLLPEEHPYRKMKGSLDFSRIKKAVKIEENDIGTTVYMLRRLIMCLILRFTENLSHRHFERYMAENLACKWFCEFGLSEKTPDFTTVCKFRKRLGLT